MSNSTSTSTNITLPFAIFSPLNSVITNYLQNSSNFNPVRLTKSLHGIAVDAFYQQSSDIPKNPTNLKLLNGVWVDKDYIPPTTISTDINISSDNEKLINSDSEGWVIIDDATTSSLETKNKSSLETKNISNSNNIPKSVQSQLKKPPESIFTAVIQSLLNTQTEVLRSEASSPVSEEILSDEKDDYYYGEEKYDVSTLPSKKSLSEIEINSISSSTLSFSLVGPPSNVKVQATSNSSAVIQWDFDETNGNADGFIVKYLHEPITGQNGRDDTSHWRSQTIMDPKARHLELVRLNSHKPYAFCVLSVKQSRLGQCSDPPVTVDKLQPTFMVQNLHIQYKTSQSVALQWEYNGPQPIQFYVKQSGQKKYLNQDLVEKRLVAPGIETKVDGNERSFMWQSLRQYMNYNFQVGVISLQDGTVYWPKELEIRTDPSGPPFVDTPIFLESRQPGTAQIKVKCASEEYGPISHYWIIVVPGNFTKDDVLNIESQFLEKSTAAMKPKISLAAAPSAKKVKKAVSDEDDEDIDEEDDEGFLTEKVKRALDEEQLEAFEYVADESLINDSGISSDEEKEIHSTPRSKRYLHESKRKLDGIYIAAKIESQEMRQLVKEEKNFVLGDGKSYHGYLNHPLDANNRYSLMMRAFAQNSDNNNQRQKDRPFEYRAPMQEPVAKLHTDSFLSETFSIRSSAANVIGKGNSSITLIIIGIVMLLMVLSVVGCLIGYKFRTKRKGTRVTRHPSITKVALPNNGYGNGNIHEASKLLDAYGRPVINGYEMNSNNISGMDTSMVDMYPTISNGNLQNGNYPTVQLPLPINSSTTAMTGSEIARGVIPIAELGKHIDRLKMNNNDLFVKEFESIDGGQHFTWKASQHEMNKLKNRYTNVTAYDHTRVLLEPIDNIPGSDYINANHIDGYLKSRAYIATQGPTPETMDDFWRMVWEQNSNVIVMLTRLEEGGRPKCEQYWPNRDKTVYGRIIVTILDTVELAHYTIRTFKIDNMIEKQAREVKHLQYTAWPDHGVPDHPTPFLMFLKRVKALAAPNAGPIISHCSAGIGRTGAFIAIDCMLDRLRHENTVDIYECVTQLRAQRAYMVQTDDQYIFIHDAVLDAAQSGSTEVPSSKLYHHMKRLLQYHPSGQTTDLEIEFSTLGRLKTLNSQCKIANLLENQTKNRSPNVLPFDTTRVILEKINGIKGSDYINASWVDGYRQRCAYIATQAPTADTANDFWRMIWEKNSCIIVIMDYNMPDYILREFKIIDQHTGDQRTIRQFQFTEWPEHGVPHGAHSFNDFVYQVHKTKSDFGNIGPITVHCNNGAGRTGVFIATGIITDRMNLEHVVDIFTTVKLLRTERQNMVETKEEYEFCYQAAVEYLSNIEDINDQQF
uniref:Protein-tyrosine-phosphatase n=1 Tax=Panagrolaimus sp. PS1159 TaxID=55785 RepID=A0AC35GJR7_9BILA